MPARRFSFLARKYAMMTRVRFRSLLSAILILAVVAQLSAARAAELLPQNVAARYGLKRSWFNQVSAAHASGVISHMNLDRGTLLVQTRFNRVVALDPETGRVFWSTQVGPQHRAATEPASNDAHVAVINGSMLYVLDRATGAELWHKQVGGTPGAGPALTPTHVFVPMLTGMMEAYDLVKGAKQTPWVYKSAGRVLGSPMSTTASVSWTTEKGYLYVADPNGKGIRYRLETGDIIHARPTHWSPQLFAGSTNGYVYALRESDGKIDWKFTVGDAIFASPIAIEDRIFVISERAGMFCLDSATGAQLWLAPGIKQFLARSPKRVYGCDQVGRMAILDAASGVRLGSMPLPTDGLKLANNESDRIYLASESGVVECLHELALVNPVIYTPPAPPEDNAEAKSRMPRDKGDKPKSAPAESTIEERADDAPAAMEDKADAPAAADEDDPFK
jgi:outer membrane protein assembly factor BamB